MLEIIICLECLRFAVAVTNYCSTWIVFVLSLLYAVYYMLGVTFIFLCHIMFINLKIINLLFWSERVRSEFAHMYTMGQKVRPQTHGHNTVKS